jgi:hypothetical protein
MSKFNYHFQSLTAQPGKGDDMLVTNFLSVLETSTTLGIKRDWKYVCFMLLTKMANIAKQKDEPGQWDRTNKLIRLAERFASEAYQYALICEISADFKQQVRCHKFVQDLADNSMLGHLSRYLVNEKVSFESKSDLQNKALKACTNYEHLLLVVHEFILPEGTDAIEQRMSEVDGTDKDLKKLKDCIQLYRESHVRTAAFRESLAPYAQP